MRYISAGIDIGTHNTRVAIAETEKNNSGLKIIGTGIAESQGLRHGYIANLDEAEKSIREAMRRAEKAAGVKIKKALVSIGGISLESAVSTGSVIISRLDGEVGDSDVEKTIEISESNLNLSNKKIIHRFPLTFKLDGKEILGRPSGMHGMKLEIKVLFITSLDQHLDDLLHAVENSGVEAEDVVASPLAASIVTLTKQQRTAGCVLANIGAETVSIAVFENDKLISLHVFPIGSTDITNDIALGLKIPLEKAEEIKVSGTTLKEFPRKRLDEIIEAQIRDIFELIEAHLKKLGRNELLPAGIIITGGGSGIATIEDLAKASLKLPARVVVPHIFNNSRGVMLEPAWSVAYGLCILGFNDLYTSDLFHINRIKVRSQMRSLVTWFKQFLP